MGIIPTSPVDLLIQMNEGTATYARSCSPSRELTSPATVPNPTQLAVLQNPFPNENVVATVQGGPYNPPPYTPYPPP